MKKVTIFILSVLCIICVALALVACDEKHEMGDWIDEIPATCTETGVVGHFHCSHCDKDFDRNGNELTDLTISVLGHDWAEEVTKQATCSEVGLKKVFCKRCDIEPQIQQIEMIAHTYGEWQQTVPSTCTEQGTQQRICSVCKNVETEALATIAHKAERVEGTPATCTDSGISDCYRCSMCEKYSFEEDGEYVFDTPDEAQREIEATGHSYGEWKVLIEPTCQKVGQQEHSCTKCDNVEATDVAMKPHDFGEWQHTIPATCTTTGVDTHSCETCGTSETRITDRDLTAHTPQKVEGKPATCTEQGLSDGQICSACGAQIVAQTVTDPLGHYGKLTYKFVKDDTFEHHTITCERVGCSGEDAPCSITVTDSRTSCTEQGTSTRKCQFCDYEQVNELAAGEHSWDKGQVTVAATCNSDGEILYTCKYCDATQKGVINVRPPHQTDGTWKTDGKTHYKLCTVCNSHLEEDDHNLTQNWVSDGTNHWHQCIVCMAHIDESSHNRVELPAKQVSCEEDGLTAGAKCSVCEYAIQKQDVIVSSGHSYGPWTDDPDTAGSHKATCDKCGNVTWQTCAYSQKVTSATCTTDGSTIEVCSICQDTIVLDTTPALGHHPGAWQAEIVKDSQQQGEVGRAEHIHQHTRVCDRCFDESTRETEPCNMGSERTVEASCDTPAFIETTCSDCGSIHEEITAPAEGHDLQYKQTSTSLFSFRHKATCSKCGYSEEEVDCTIVTEDIQATCTENRRTFYKCAVCGQGRSIPEANTALGHILSQPTFCGDAQNPQHKQYCTRENCHESTDAEPCILGSETNLPTCEAAGSVKTFCTVCLSTISEGELESVGHKWTSWIFEDADKHYQRCENCRETVSEPHEYQIVSQTTADCEHLGVTIKSCKHCNNRIEETSGTLTTHKWVDVTFSPTQHSARCTVCNKTASGNHDWSQSNLCSVCGYDGLIYETSGAHCIVTSDEQVKNAKSIVIPEKHKILNDDGSYDNTEYAVEEIGENAFHNNSNIETLTFPSTVKVIREMAFYCCSGLKTVTLTGENHNLTQIESYAFAHCKMLETFYPPETLESIGDYAFSDCLSLVNIRLGDRVTDIGQGVFHNTGYVNSSENWENDQLYLGQHLIKVRQTQQPDGSFSNVTVEVEPGTLSISVAAFSECTSVTKVVLPDSLKIIDRDAFKDCTTIEHVEFNGTVRQWFEINFINDYSSPLHYGSPSLHIALAHDGITIPDGVTRIPAGTFRGTEIKSIVIPESVTYIGEEAFENCTQLTDITVNSTQISYIGKDAFTGSAYYTDPSHWDNGTVLYVGNYLIDAKSELSGSYNTKNGTIAIANEAFKGCTGLTEITIDESMRYVGEYAFADCNALTTIVFEDTSHRWFMIGQIGRSVDVQGQNFSYYKVYYGAWRRL